VKAARSSLLAAGAEVLFDMVVLGELVGFWLELLFWFGRLGSRGMIWMLRYNGEGERYLIYHRREHCPAGND
jgi:hypothetical protein